MTGPLARIEVDPDRDGLWIGLFGEIDLSNAQTVLSRVREVIAEAAPERVLVDLAGVEYIDSQGVMLLLKIAGSLRESRTPLRLLAPVDSPAGQVLAISHLDDLAGERLTGEAGA
ncbi:MAG: hypothetical protein QOF83_618 [Solirubrobacteraceae bacterium]|jgi:anti-anti-sigma factor|nr:hypothetical protein [Solirubrobacteraceae bacterium]